jgi:hypothetical protein
MKSWSGINIALSAENVLSQSVALINRNHLAPSLLMLCISLSLPVLAANQQSSSVHGSKASSVSPKVMEEPAPEALNVKIRAAKVINPKFQLLVTKGSDGYAVTTEKDPKFTNDDESIVQAVLIGKTLFDNIPRTNMTAKILFEARDGRVYRVLLNRLPVEDYAGGKVSRQELVGSFRLEYMKHKSAVFTTSGASGAGGANGAVHQHVVEGPLSTRRERIYRRIKALSDVGANMTEVKKKFDTVEDSAKNHDRDAVATGCDEINEALSSQMEMLKSVRYKHYKQVRSKSADP